MDFDSETWLTIDLLNVHVVTSNHKRYLDYQVKCLHILQITDLLCLLTPPYIKGDDCGYEKWKYIALEPTEIIWAAKYDIRQNIKFWCCILYAAQSLRPQATNHTVMFIILAYYRFFDVIIVSVTGYDPVYHGLRDLTRCEVTSSRVEWHWRQTFQCPGHGVSGRYIVIQSIDEDIYRLRLCEVMTYGYGKTIQLSSGKRN